MKNFLKFFLSLVLISLLLFIAVVFLLVNRYKGWEEIFESNMIEQNLVTYDSQKDALAEEKIVEFTLSSENTQSLILTPREVGGILIDISKGYLQNLIEVGRIYIEPEVGVWNVYVELKYRKISVWISLDLNKDSMQTAQLYTTDIKVGPYSLGGIGHLAERINMGIANAVLTVNENGFSGRYLENIELLENSVVIKGYRY